MGLVKAPRDANRPTKERLESRNEKSRRDIFAEAAKEIDFVGDLFVLRGCRLMRKK